MAKKSSGAEAARDVAQVASAGKQGKKEDSGNSSSRRRLFRFSTVIVVILVLGVGLVVIAKANRDFSPPPRQNTDHWHSAYAVWDCQANEELGAFEPPFLSTDDGVGIHSHQDNVIHIHPWFERSSGNDATLSHFFTAMRATVTKEAITIPGGGTLTAGVECDGEPSIITVRRWRDINNLDRDPVIYTDDFGEIQLMNTGEVFVIARAPKGADVETPPLSILQNVYDSTQNLISRAPLEDA